MSERRRRAFTRRLPRLALGLSLAIAPAASARTGPAPPIDKARPAPTAEQLEQARALFVTGSEAYREEKYDVAIDAFEAAFALAPRASVMFALAQATRLQYFVDGKFERIERAVELYRGYLSRDDADPDQADVAVRHLAWLNTQLAELQRQQDDSVARVIVSSDAPGATVRVGDQPVQEVPAAFEVPPGTIQLTVEAPGYVAQVREVVAVGGTGLPIDVSLQPLPGELEIITEEGAEIRIDGRSLGVAPLPAQQLTPGVHRVVILQPGRIAEVRTVAVEHSRQTRLEAPLEMSNQRVGAWALFGLAGALAVTAGASGVIQYRAQMDAEALYDAWRSDGLDPDEVADYSAYVAERNTWSQRTVALGVGAGVAAAVGAALWLLDDPQAPNQPVLTPTITPTVAPGGAGVALWGRFDF